MLKQQRNTRLEEKHRQQFPKWFKEKVSENINLSNIVI